MLQYIREFSLLYFVGTVYSLFISQLLEISGIQLFLIANSTILLHNIGSAPTYVLSCLTKFILCVAFFGFFIGDIVNELILRPFGVVAKPIIN